MSEDHDDSALETLLEKDPEQARKEAKRIYRTFLIMSCCFALTMGTVTTIIAFAGAQFPSVGNQSVGVLFGAYCISALFFGNVIVGMLGLKTALICGIIQYVVYSAMYTIAFFLGKDSEVAKSLILVGAAVGGVASGYLWTAQGAYFAQCAKKYAKCTGQAEEDATNEFSSRFATIFLFNEITFKFIGAGLSKIGKGDKQGMPMYLIFTVLCALAAFGMTTIESVSAEAREKPTVANILKKAGLALGLLASDPKMLFMLPFEISFGFAGAFLNGVVSPHVTKPIIGIEYVGFFAGIVAGVACVVSAAGGYIIKKTGLKWPNMFAGGLCFTLMTGIFWVLNTKKWGSGDVGILVVVYALQGVGRGIFESTNKAVIADFFGSSGNAPAAFANVIWSSGGASAVGYFLFTSLTGAPSCVQLEEKVCLCPSELKPIEQRAKIEANLHADWHSRSCSLDVCWPKDKSGTNVCPKNPVGVTKVGHPLCNQSGVHTEAALCTIISIAGIICYFIALGFKQAQRRKQTDELDPKLLE